MSLSRARKARARAEKRAQADANAAKHGRSKAERAAEIAKARQESDRLDGHERE